MKKTNRINLKQVVLSILLCFSVMITATGCGEQDKSGTTSSTSTDIERSEENTKQLHSFIIPKSILDETDALYAESQFNDNSVTVLLESGEEVPVKSVYTSIIVNEDGTATYKFTDEQLKSYLYETACSATLSRINSEAFSEYNIVISIKSTEFTDDDLTGIIVYVDGSTYDNFGVDGSIHDNFGVDGSLIMSAARYMGLYQVMSGVDPEEWNVHVTVKDYETGEIITEVDYPTDR